MSTQKCNTCQEEKELDCFEARKNPSGNITYRGTCKACRKESRKKAVEQSETKNTPKLETKPTKCTECGLGPPQVDFQWRTDQVVGCWRPICYACVNAKGYSDKSRAKKREEDEEAYLKHNAQVHLEWARKNPEKVKEQQLKTVTQPNRKLSVIRTSAGIRKIDFAEADQEIMKAKLSEPCFYCNHVVSKGEKVHGLDRVDPELGYTANNTVPCCSICNNLKGCMDMSVFVHTIRRIIAHRQWSLDVAVGGSLDRKTRISQFAGRLPKGDEQNKKEKPKTDHLTVDERLSLQCAPCYLCGMSPAFGVDREDATKDYTLENSKPCCSECNYMKKDLSLVNFEMCVVAVARHTVWWVINNVNEKPIKTCVGQIRKHVKVLDSNGGTILVFPSSDSIAEFIGVSKQSIIKAIRSGGKCKGYSWDNATIEEMRTQQKSKNEAINVIKDIMSD